MNAACFLKYPSQDCIRTATSFFSVAAAYSPMVRRTPLILTMEKIERIRI